MKTVEQCIASQFAALTETQRAALFAQWIGRDIAVILECEADECCSIIAYEPLLQEAEQWLKTYNVQQRSTR